MFDYPESLTLTLDIHRTLVREATPNSPNDCIVARALRDAAAGRIGAGPMRANVSPHMISLQSVDPEGGAYYVVADLDARVRQLIIDFDFNRHVPTPQSHTLTLRRVA